MRTLHFNHSILFALVVFSTLASCRKEVIQRLEGFKQTACSCATPIDSSEQNPPPVKEGTIARVTTVAFGSSSIALWPHLEDQAFGIPIIKKGFGGRGIMDLYYKVDTEVSAYHPAQIIVYTGDNDLVRTDLSTTEIISRYKKLYNKLRSQNKDAYIIIIPIKASPYLAAQGSRIRGINEAISKYVSTDTQTNFAWAMYKSLFTVSGNYRTDLYEKNSVHLSAKGYEVWTQELEKCLLKVQQ